MGVLPVFTSSFGDSGGNLTVQTLLGMFVFVENIVPLCLLWLQYYSSMVQYITTWYSAFRANYKLVHQLRRARQDTLNNNILSSGCDVC